MSLDAHKKSAESIILTARNENRQCFPYLSRGKLNNICLRTKDRDVIPIETNNDKFLTNEEVARTTTIDTITFAQNAIFKVTLDFKEPKQTLVDSFTKMTSQVRETTDWMLLSCPGSHAFFDRVAQRLCLTHCLPCVSAIPDMVMPLTMILLYDEGQWTVDRVFGQ